MAAKLADAPRLQFDGGQLLIDGLELPEVVPADPLESPPTKFVYTGNTEVILRISTSNCEFARRLFDAGGAHPCNLMPHSSAEPRPLEFHPVNLTIDNEWGSMSGAMTGWLTGITQPGASVDDRLSRYYTSLHKPSELTQGELAESTYWSDVAWDW